MGGHGHEDRDHRADIAGSATEKEMMDARIPLAYRDKCAHILIPLNKCRVKHFYSVRQCEWERHLYEKCQYLDYLDRVDMLNERKSESRSG